MWASNIASSRTAAKTAKASMASQHTKQKESVKDKTQKANLVIAQKKQKNALKTTWANHLTTTRANAKTAKASMASQHKQAKSNMASRHKTEIANVPKPTKPTKPRGGSSSFELGWNPNTSSDSSGSSGSNSVGGSGSFGTLTIPKPLTPKPLTNSSFGTLTIPKSL